MNYPPILEKLISYYEKLPGIGKKSAERLALATIDFSNEEVLDFKNTLWEAKSTLTRCSICGNITDSQTCSICNDKARKENIICVLEDYKNILSFERTGKYQGTYHVLNGLISPIDNVGPDDINLQSLINRIEKLTNVELILALKPTIEGETTILYIKKIFEDKGIIISRLSYGIPIGTDLDYLDNATLQRALEDRKKILE